MSTYSAMYDFNTAFKYVERVVEPCGFMLNREKKVRCGGDLYLTSVGMNGGAIERGGLRQWV